MIRSLVAQKNEAGEIQLRRNVERDALADALHAGNTLWIDMVDPEDEEIGWLKAQLNLHLLVVNDLTRQDRRPTLEVYDTYAFISLFQPLKITDRIHPEEVHCIYTETALVTVRQSASKAIDEAYELTANTTDYWQNGSVQLLYLACQHIVDSYYPLLDRINERLGKLEEAALTGESIPLTRGSLFRIKQQLVILRGMIAPQREVMSNIIAGSPIGSSSENRELFRHLYERILRVYDVIDGQRDLWTNVIDLFQNQESSRLSQAVNRLTIVSMIFLPMTFLLSLFELNFITTKTALEIPLPGGFMLGLLVLFMVGSTAGMLAFFRRQGWL